MLIIIIIFDRINDAGFLVDVQNWGLRSVEEHIHNCHIFPDDYGEVGDHNDSDHDDSDDDDDGDHDYEDVYDLA